MPISTYCKHGNFFETIKQFAECIYTTEQKIPEDIIFLGWPVHAYQKCIVCVRFLALKVTLVRFLLHFDSVNLLISTIQAIQTMDFIVFIKHTKDNNRKYCTRSYFSSLFYSFQQNDKIYANANNCHIFEDIENMYPRRKIQTEVKSVQIPFYTS